MIRTSTLEASWAITLVLIRLEPVISLLLPKKRGASWGWFKSFLTLLIETVCLLGRSGQARGRLKIRVSLVFSCIEDNALFKQPKNLMWSS